MKFLLSLMLSLSSGIICFNSVVYAENIFISKENSFIKKIKDIESENGTRIGIYAEILGSGKNLSYRSTERFPFCSVFKYLVVGAVLDSSSISLDETIRYTSKDLVEAYSPITKKNLKSGMRVKDLAHAAILSDNSAANILMNLMDQKLNSVVQFARKAGDTKFRLDRWEPYLNTAIPGDLRDTTTAESTATAFTNISFGNAISKKENRDLFNMWIKKTVLV